MGKVWLSSKGNRSVNDLAADLRSDSMTESWERGRVVYIEISHRDMSGNHSFSVSPKYETIKMAMPAGIRVLWESDDPLRGFLAVACPRR